MESNDDNRIILVGEKNSGKTSIFSMIFTNLYPSETSFFESTQSISKNQIIFSGGELIELYDCGFEEKIEKNELYLNTEPFENISTLIYVLSIEPPKHTINSNDNSFNNEISSNNNYDTDLYKKIEKNNLFDICMQLLIEKSPKAKIYILIHKIDTISIDKRKNIFEEKKNEINQKLFKLKLDSNSKIYATSIWDGSLYNPWREIMSDMVVNKKKLEKGLYYLLEACGSDEIFLFERSTLLCICSVDKGKNNNKDERTKKISILFKKLKQVLRKNKTEFSCLKMKLNNILVYIEKFSKYCYIMILSQKPKINYEFLSLNIYILKKKFFN